MKILCKIIFLLFFCSELYAQKNEDYYQKIIDTTKNSELKLAALDSLIHNVGNQKNLTKFADRTEQYVDLAIQLERYDDAIKFAIRGFHNINAGLNQRKRALTLIEKVEQYKDKVTNSYLIGGIYQKKAGAYSATKDYLKSIENFTLAINSYQDNSKDSIHKADALQFRAHEYFDNGQFLKAIEDYRLSAKYYDLLGDKEYMNYSLGGIINVYGANGFNQKTIEEREKLIKKRIAENFSSGLYVEYYNQSLNYKKLDSLQKQEAFLLKANEAIALIKDKDLPTYHALVIKSSLISFYAKSKDIGKAKKYLEEATPYYNKIDKNASFAAEFYKAKARYLFALSKYEEALVFAKKSYKLFRKNANVNGIMNSSELLSDIYTEIGNQKLALSSFKTYSKIKDSIFSVTKTNALSYYQTLYETERQEKEISEQKASINSLAKENEAKRRLLLFGSVSVALLFFIFYLYRNKQQALKKKKMQEEYSQNLLISQEEERKRISKDLHDSLGQSLLLIKNKVALKSDAKTKELVNNAIEEMRSIARVLHPFQLEDIGISRALENLILQLDESYENTYIFGNIDDIKNILPKEKEVNVFRIVQECLSNIIKHANADSAKVNVINNKNNIVISIKDNGIGFDFSEKYNDFKSLGLKTIKERVKFLNGTLKIDSVKSQGTTFTIQFSK
ncbi:ATP-binding protein [uncultured Polaribacter sp.]|uniref:tetratricopeptide repeat-containing sensor histidine kinase n=1 Tax=uncultured Polaribacter sp. TaxID=174711 RepID=UPI00261B4CC8|nr:ATP-binding protein [uncultured Polaribacter sp.]